MFYSNTLISTQAMRALCALKQYGTLAHASKPLGLSQPAITFQLKSLEEHFGIPLLERRGRRVEFTPAGERLAQEFQLILSRLEFLSSETHHKKPSRGILKIGTVEGMADSVVIPLMDHFHKKHPESDFGLLEDQNQNLFAALTNWAISMAFIPEKSPLPQLISQPFIKERLIPVGPITPSLAPMKWIGYTGDDPWPRLFLKKFKTAWLMSRKKLTSDFLTGHIASHATRYSVLLQWIRQGKGIAVLPETVVQKEIQLKRIRRLGNPKKHYLENQLYLVRRRGHLDPLHEKFWDTCLKTLEK